MLNVNFWNIAFIVIDLVILYLFMRHFLFGPVSGILEERRNMVERDLDEAKSTREAADALKRQYEESMGNAREEAGQILAAARERAGKEYDQILEKAREDAGKKLADADKTIALEREKAMNDLKAGVAGLAMTAAARLLKEQSGEKTDRELYNRFLAESGEGHD